MPLKPEQKSQVNNKNTSKEVIVTLVNELTKEEIIELLQKNLSRDDLAALINNCLPPGTMLELINSHNPYTTNEPDDMSIFVGNPNPSDKEKNDVSQVELEVDGPYSMAMEWNFKGSPQKINKTIRVQYRYRAKDLNTKTLLKPAHWVTAYLLIGFEDGGI